MKRILLAVFLVLGAGPALASGRNPQLPSSGIVVHLFGPEGVWSNALPTVSPPANSTGPAAGAPAAGAPAAGAPAGAAAADDTVAGSPAPPGAATPTAPAAYPEPSLGTVLHQMFITGDPDRGPGFSAGRQKAY